MVEKKNPALMVRGSLFVCFCLYWFVCFCLCFLFLLLVGIGGGDEGDGVLKGGLESALLVLGVDLDLHGDTVLGAAVD